MLDTVEFEFDKERLKVYYESLSMEEKMVALQNTYGYITDKQRQWDLNETQATNTGYPTFTSELGNIKVGGRYVEEMLEYVTAALDDEIFQVFSSLKTLSDSLNGYFAGGLSDDDDYMAADAIASAQDIEKRTKETRNPESIK